jgi:hypothetical protein
MSNKGERIYQFNLQLFPVTVPKAKEALVVRDESLGTSEKLSEKLLETEVILQKNHTVDNSVELNLR